MKNKLCCKEMSQKLFPFVKMAGKDSGVLIHPNFQHFHAFKPHLIAITNINNTYHVHVYCKMMSVLKGDIINDQCLMQKCFFFLACIKYFCNT